MRPSVYIVTAGMFIGGCATVPQSAGLPQQQPAAPTVQLADDQTPIASIDGRDITLVQLQKPLVESYGLNLLLNLAQLEALKHEVAEAKLEVTAEDLASEKRLTLEKLFKDSSPRLQEELEKAQRENRAADVERLRAQIAQENEQLLEQMLQQKRITRPEFEIVLQINAYLRKLAEPKIEGKITEENLREAFHTLYGENVQVRHIQVSNMQEIVEARRRLNAGEPFENVARSLSRNARTAALGGELPPFSREASHLPETFRQAAFLLKPGEVSDPVHTGDAYHLIKLEKRIAPKAVKFEDYREIVRAQLHERWLQATINSLRQNLQARIVRDLKIFEPTLRSQFEQKKNQQAAEAKDRDQVRRELERERLRAATNPTTTPATIPATAPATTGRPPATTSGPAPDSSVSPATQVMPATMPGR